MGKHEVVSVATRRWIYGDSVVAQWWFNQVSVGLTLVMVVMCSLWWWWLRRRGGGSVVVALGKPLFKGGVGGDNGVANLVFV